MNTILFRLTKLQLRAIRGSYIRTQTVQLPDGKQREVMVYSGDKSLFLGQCTMFRTIIIHQSTLGNKPLLDYVLSHEMAHTKQWWAIFIVPLLFLLPVSIFSSILTLAYMVRAIVLLDPYSLLSSLVGIPISALLFAIPCGFSWIMELNADFKAIKVVGFQTFLEVKNAPKLIKLDFSSKVIIRMTHPPTKVTAKLWHCFHKHEAEYQI